MTRAANRSEHIPVVRILAVQTPVWKVFGKYLSSSSSKPTVVVQPLAQ